MAIENEIIRAALKYSAPNASQGQTVHWYRVEGGNPTDLAVLNAIDDFVTLDWAPSWADLADTNASLDSVDVDVINPIGTVNRNLGSFNVGVSGALAGNVNPAAVAGLLSVPTAIPKTRGRKYIPFTSQLALVEGAWGAGALADLAVLLADYFEPIIIAGAQQLVAGVLSKTLQQFVDFIQTGRVRGLPRTQKRRYDNVGS